MYDPMSRWQSNEVMPEPRYITSLIVRFDFSHLVSLSRTTRGLEDLVHVLRRATTDPCNFAEPTREFGGLGIVATRIVWVQ